MRAPVSIVIPTLNASAALPGCLAALMEGVTAGLIRELIVSDAGSSDETAAIAQAAGARVVTGEASRGGQLRRGVAATDGAWVLIVHADSVLAPGWTVAVEQALDESRARYFDLAFDARGTGPALIARWANLRARVFGLPYGDQGLLISRALYDTRGGYADQPLMEDVAMARALRGQLQPLGHRVTTSYARYAQAGAVKRGARNLLTLGRYLAGADPEVLARRYRKP